MQVESTMVSPHMMTAVDFLLAFLHCVFANLSSNYLHENMTTIQSFKGKWKALWCPLLRRMSWIFQTEHSASRGNVRIFPFLWRLCELLWFVLIWSTVNFFLLPKDLSNLIDMVKQTCQDKMFWNFKLITSVQFRNLDYVCKEAGRSVKIKKENV